MAENGNGNGSGSSLELRFGPLYYKGSGTVAIQFLIYIVLLSGIGYGIYMNQIQHEALVRGLNDVFVSSPMTPEQKQDLPRMVKEKLEEKVKQKADKIVKDNPIVP